MTRKRDSQAGIFHVPCHSVWDGVLFRDDIDRANYIHELARTTETVGWTCIAVCLLTTHAHLVLEVEDGILAEGMQRLNFRHAANFNSRHLRRGRVFGAPYSQRRVLDEAYLRNLYRYVALNPVEAGLAERPQDWAWCSYRSAVGLSADFGFVNPARALECFGRIREVAVRGLRQFVEGS
jgi:REP element-mobilizing transposase RayT